VSINLNDIPYKEMVAGEQSKSDLHFKLQQLDALLCMSSEILELYFIGGSACILGDLIYRMTMDIDILDIDYPSKIGKFLSILEPYDLLEFTHTSVSRTYIKRAKLLTGFKNLKCYILSPEDLIISKLCRYSEKDIQDIEILMTYSKKEVLDTIINEVEEDLHSRIPRIAENFMMNVKIFIRRFDSDV